MMISVNDLIKKGLLLCKNNIVVLIKYLILTLLPSLVLIVVCGIVYTGLKYTSLLTNSYFLGLIITLGLLAFAVTSLVSLWFNFALIKVIYKLIKKQEVGEIKDNIQEAKEVIWTGLGTSVVAAFLAFWPLLAATLGYLFVRLVLEKFSGLGLLSQTLNILFGLFGLYGFFHLVRVAIRLIFSTYSAVIEKNKIMDAISASKNMVTGKWWAVLGRVFVPALLIWILLMIVSSILDSIGDITGQVGYWLFTIINSLLSFLVTPITLAFVIILYEDLRGTASQTTAKTIVKKITKK